MPRILIVDDEPEMVRGLEDNLRFEHLGIDGSLPVLVTEEPCPRRDQLAHDHVIFQSVQPVDAAFPQRDVHRRRVAAGIR